MLKGNRVWQSGARGPQLARYVTILGILELALLSQQHLKPPVQQSFKWRLSCLASFYSQASCPYFAFLYRSVKQQLVDRTFGEAKLYQINHAAQLIRIKH